MDLKKGQIVVLTKDLKWSCGTIYGRKGQLLKLTGNYFDIEDHDWIEVEKISGKLLDIQFRDLRLASDKESQAFENKVSNVNLIAHES
jgi:hypothetical protein